jgi:hypothetical protein
LETVTDVSGWDEYTQLPVVSRKNVLIGTLERRSVTQFAFPQSLQSSIAANQPILLALAASFYASAVGLFQILTGSSVDTEDHTSIRVNSSAGGNDE